MRFGLLFERFLNPERVSMPDFDIDFCQERRDEVIAYVRDRYGADRVAQIITFGSFLARGVMRNVGRVLEMPLGQVDKLAKLVPQNPAKPVTLKQAMADEARLQEAAKADENVAKMLAIAEKLEGLYSNASTHAAGVVIGDRPLDRTRAALSRSEIGDAGDAVQHEMGRTGRPRQIRLSRPENADRAASGRSTARPARRSRSISARSRSTTRRPTRCWGAARRSACSRWKAAACARRWSRCAPTASRTLSRWSRSIVPGPMANIPTYCARKLGQEKPDYIHPKIEPILRETYGVIIYQEQVMQIAQVLSGYSLGEADMLRRAMGKKIKAEMDAQRARFVDGAVERGLTKAKADEIFDLLRQIRRLRLQQEPCGAPMR